jgi:TonB family protein
MKTQMVRPLLIVSTAALLFGCASSSQPIAIVQDFDAPPKPIRTPAPEYPAKAIEADVHGATTIDFIVTREGKVTELAFLEPLDGQLQDSIRKAAKKWTFTPAMKMGAPVDSRLQTSIQFRRADTP